MYVMPRCWTNGDDWRYSSLSPKPWISSNFYLPINLIIKRLVKNLSVHFFMSKISFLIFYSNIVNIRAIIFYSNNNTIESNSSKIKTDKFLKC